MKVVAPLPLIEASVTSVRGAAPPLTLLAGELTSATLTVRNVVSANYFYENKREIE